MWRLRRFFGYLSQPSAWASFGYGRGPLLGGSVILSEFPELCGVEQELCDRCVDADTARRFAKLMTTYNDRAKSLAAAST